jgi:SAM-dependent methyltransferase
MYRPFSEQHTTRQDAFRWGNLGAHFPSLKNAYSTRYYQECERLLIKKYFPALPGARILKTDLWNEARSTELLFWLSDQGAEGVGVDIAFSTAQMALANRNGHRAHMLVADVRDLPFEDGSFDYIYSMGTIEHFPDYLRATEELYRVLAPGGLAIIGVPNLYDPFARPLIIWLLCLVNGYPYSPEKAFSPKALKRLMADAGFEVRGLSGALFMPGWLRMLDLLLHTKKLKLAKLTAWATRPFAALYRRFPKLRRHSYLIAAVVQKPGELPAITRLDHPESHPPVNR